MSLQLRTRLVNSIENKLKFCKLKVIFQSPCKPNSLSCCKDSLTKKLRSDIVYRYSVVTARLLIMVIHTTSSFTSSAEHMGISNLTGKRLKHVKQSAVSDHLLKCNCSIEFDHFDILASIVKKFRVVIKETFLIKRDQPQLNKTTKLFPLKLFN